MRGENWEWELEKAGDFSVFSTYIFINNLRIVKMMMMKGHFPDRMNQFGVELQNIL